VLSWNIGGTDTEETDDMLKQRATDIANSIINGDYDIACLQEVWTDTVRNILQENLQPKYPWIMLKAFGNGPTTESGLFMASKYPMKDQVFAEYTTTQPDTPDALLDKGIHGVIIRYYTFLFLR
jgi:hypothetical protein